MPQLTPIPSRCRGESICGRDASRATGRKVVLVIFSGNGLGSPIRPRASSRSRKGSSPASDVTFEPWNSSLRRWSNVTRRAAPSASPTAPSMSRPAAADYSFVQYTEIGLALHPPTCASGECGLRTAQLPERCGRGDPGKRHRARTRWPGANRPERAASLSMAVKKMARSSRNRLRSHASLCTLPRAALLGRGFRWSL